MMLSVQLMQFIAIFFITALQATFKGWIDVMKDSIDSVEVTTSGHSSTYAIFII